MPQDFAKIKEYQDQSAKLVGQAGQYNAGSNVLGDKVMEAVRADRTSRGVSKLATDVGNVSGQMVTDPNAIREGPQSLSGQGLVDPFSVNQLTSNARAQNLKTLGTVATQGLMNQGSIDEVIKAGADQLRAKAAAMLAKAEEASQMAVSLQGEWERELEQKQFDENVRQFNETQKSKVGGGGPSNISGTLRTWAETFAAGLATDEARASFWEDYNGLVGDKFDEQTIMGQLSSTYSGMKTPTPQINTQSGYAGQGALNTWSSIYNSSVGQGARGTVSNIGSGVANLSKEVWNNLKYVVNPKGWGK